jgi:hypothetical protein
VPLTRKCAPGRFSTPAGGGSTAWRTMTAFVVTLGLLDSAGRGTAFFGRLQFHTRTAGFRQTDRDRLACRARAMLAFPDVVEFLADELSRLR